MNVDIAPMSAAHFQGVRQIYEEGITTGNATFETVAPSWDAFDESHLANCRIVALDGDRVIGWAALTPVSRRAVYSGVCEVSVYVAASARGQGVGRALLQELISQAEADNRWTLQAGIFPENVGSVALHVAAGFRHVGTRERIGVLDGVWRDVHLFERRRRD